MNGADFRGPLIGGALLALVAAALLGGCSAAGTVPAKTSTAAEQAPAPAIEHDLGPPRYRRLLATTFGELERFWDNQLPDLGAKRGEPKLLVSYWNRRQDPGCAGHPAGPRNAQYCAPTQTIAWDGNWVFGRLYRDFGDAAVSFLLAHEYGHFVQDRLGIARKFPLTIEAELNADCLAGAWLEAMNRKVQRFHNVDYRALAAGLLNVADPRGVPWANPSAHGRAGERRRALLVGVRHGQRGCLRQLGPGFSS